MQSSQPVAEMESLLTGDESRIECDEDFRALVERQSRFVFRVAYAVLRNVEDAEDAVQDAFLKVYRSGGWRRAEDEKAFLARTVWRVAVDRLSHRRQDSLTGDPVATEANPEDLVIRDNWQSLVHRLVDALPEDLRQPLAFSAIEEISSAEIGRVMGIPEGTVRTRIMRARQILKDKLAAYRSTSHGK